ncbi:MAG: HNH endonuclease, partial [Rubrivivax sp.]|nr:HNH endonuclease [Rubrivivax sp.]
ARKMESDLKGRRKLAWLWYWQEGLCPCCNQKITKTTGWHIHHVVKRSEGGLEQMSNLQLLHPNCHRQHHANE